MMSQVGLGRVTVYRCHESVDWTALRTYASSGNDRRQNILDAYIQKHVDSGHRDNEYSILPVEYYRLPHYGRALVRGLGGQKLTRLDWRHLAHIAQRSMHPVAILVF